MGQQSSVQAQTDIVSNALTNILMKNAQECSQNTSIVQSLEFNDIESTCPLIFSGINQDAKIVTNFSCAQDSSNSADLLNKFKTELDQDLKAQTSGIAGAAYSQSKVDVINKLKNDIKNNIDISNIAKCVNTSIGDQKIKFGKIKLTGKCPKDIFGREIQTEFKNIGQKIVLENVAKCVQANKNLSKLSNELDNSVKTKASAILEGINPAVSASGSFSCLSIIVICVIISIFIAMSANMGDDGGINVQRLPLKLKK